MTKYELLLRARFGSSIPKEKIPKVIVKAADERHAERLWAGMKNQREFHGLEISGITPAK